MEWLVWLSLSPAGGPVPVRRLLAISSASESPSFTCSSLSTSSMLRLFTRLKSTKRATPLLFRLRSNWDAELTWSRIVLSCLWLGVDIPEPIVMDCSLPLSSGSSTVARYMWELGECHQSRQPSGPRGRAPQICAALDVSIQPGRCVDELLLARCSDRC